MDIEKEAKEMGWVPEAEFRGNKDLWVGAEEFVEKGKHVIPIMRQNNERLKRELLTRDEKLDTLQASLAASNLAIEKLEAHYTAANKRAVELAKIDLKAQLVAAREDQDVDAELAVLDQINALKDAGKTPEPDKAPVKKDPPANALSAEFQAWQAENDWYGPDKKKTKSVMRLAEDLRDEGNQLVGRAFMDAVMDEYERLNPPSDDEDGAEPAARKPVSKVEGGSGRVPVRGGSKSFAGLPADAKEACWADLDDLVGPGKRYKTQAEWEKKYADIYYAN